MTQKTWDACLIRCWRLNLNLFDVFEMYASIVGAEPTDLLRMPRGGMPRRIGVRVFVDSYLHKISERMWSQDPAKDVLLLRKLQESSYNTTDKAHSSNGTRDLQTARRQVTKNTEKARLDNWKYGNRNHATDWGVTK